jgi:hypothetical protein
MTDTTKPLINKVAQKALITLDLEAYFPKDEELAFIDLKDYLFKGLILREADFRETVKNTDWGRYKNKYVAICDYTHVGLYGFKCRGCALCDRCNL